MEPSFLEDWAAVFKRDDGARSGSLVQSLKCCAQKSLGDPVKM